MLYQRDKMSFDVFPIDQPRFLFRDLLFPLRNVEVVCVIAESRQSFIGRTVLRDANGKSLHSDPPREIEIYRLKHNNYTPTNFTGNRRKSTQSPQSKLQAQNHLLQQAKHFQPSCQSLQRFYSTKFLHAVKGRVSTWIIFFVLRSIQRKMHLAR